VKQWRQAKSGKKIVPLPLRGAPAGDPDSRLWRAPGEVRQREAEAAHRPRRALDKQAEALRGCWQGT